MVTDLEILKERVTELEKELREARKEYYEVKHSKLREAYQAREEANKTIEEELKSMGYTPYSNPLSFRFYR